MDVDDFDPEALLLDSDDDDGDFDDLAAMSAEVQQLQELLGKSHKVLNDVEAFERGLATKKVGRGATTVNLGAGTANEDAINVDEDADGETEGAGRRGARSRPDGSDRPRRQTGVGAAEDARTSRSSRGGSLPKATAAQRQGVCRGASRLGGKEPGGKAAVGEEGEGREGNRTARERAMRAARRQQLASRKEGGAGSELGERAFSTSSDEATVAKRSAAVRARGATTSGAGAARPGPPPPPARRAPPRPPSASAGKPARKSSKRQEAASSAEASPSPQALLSSSVAGFHEALSTNRALQARLRKVLADLAASAERNAQLSEELEIAVGSARGGSGGGRARGDAGGLLGWQPDGALGGSADVIDVDPMRAPAMLAPQTRNWFWEGIVEDRARWGDRSTQGVSATGAEDGVGPDDQGGGISRPGPSAGVDADDVQEPDPNSFGDEAESLGAVDRASVSPREAVLSSAAFASLPRQDGSLAAAAAPVDRCRRSTRAGSARSAGASSDAQVSASDEVHPSATLSTSSPEYLSRVNFLRAVGDALPPWPPRTAWTARERTALRSAVATIAQEEAVQRHLDEMERELDWDFDVEDDLGPERIDASGSGPSWASPGPHSVRDARGVPSPAPPPSSQALSVSFVSRRMEVERLATDPRLVDEASRRFSAAGWARVARAAGLRRRGWAEVAAAWRADVRPTLREGAWTPDEDDALRRAVERWGDRNWEAVADEGLGGKRSALQCLGRYGRMETVWTRERANQSADGVEKAAAIEERSELGNEADPNAGEQLTDFVGSSTLFVADREADEGGAPGANGERPRGADKRQEADGRPIATTDDSLVPGRTSDAHEVAKRPEATHGSNDTNPRLSRAEASLAAPVSPSSEPAACATTDQVTGDGLAPATRPSRQTSTRNSRANDPTTDAAAVPPPASSSLPRPRATSRPSKRSTPGSSVDLDRLLEATSRHGRRWKLVAAEFDNRWRPQQLMHVWRRFVQREGIAGRSVSGAGERVGLQRDEQGRDTPDRVFSDAPATATGIASNASPEAAPAVLLQGARPVPRKGRWTTEEDDALTRAVALFGTKWSRVSPLVPGRTDVQCRERWVNGLSAGIERGKPWTESEDERLARIVQTLRRPDGRVRWAAVAREMPGRTDSMVAKRWKKVHQEARGGG